MENRLNLLEGKYYLKHDGAELTIEVDYDSGSFKINWLSEEKNKKVIARIESWAVKFAQDMLKDKSHKNFYKQYNY